METFRRRFKSKNDHNITSFVLIFYFIFNYEIHYQETSIASSWYELLSVVHMMAMLSLSEANTILIPKDGIDTSERMVLEGLFLL